MTVFCCNGAARIAGSVNHLLQVPGGFLGPGQIDDANGYCYRIEILCFSTRESAWMTASSASQPWFRYPTYQVFHASGGQPILVVAARIAEEFQGLGQGRFAQLRPNQLPTTAMQFFHLQELFAGFMGWHAVQDHQIPMQVFLLVLIPLWPAVI